MLLLQHNPLCFMKKLLFYIFLLVSVPALSNGVTRQARENIKKKQKLEQTVKDLVGLAKKEDTPHRLRIECYMLAAECSKRINEVENEKLYLKQAYDTTKFYASIQDMYRYMELADSVSSTPNEKGVIKRKNPRSYRDFLRPYRSNLLNGGLWHFSRNRSAQAYNYFDNYLNTAKSAVFVQDNYFMTDTLMPSAAYMAVFAAQDSKNLDGVIKYAKMAKRAGQKSYLVQEYFARAYEAKEDTAHWIPSLYDGMREFPQHHYFFSHLLDYLTETKQYERGMTVCDSMIQESDTVALYWYAKGMLLLRQHKDREAIDACDSCLALDSTFVNAYYNKGIAALNLALIATEHACTDVTDPQSRIDRQTIHNYYLLAKGPMEKVRALEPENSDRWAAPLYRIYLNLNMGKEFDEMEKIVNSVKTKAK